MGLSSVGSSLQMRRKVDVITSSATWTAPAGVTYVVATIIGGGGGGHGIGTGGLIASNAGNASSFAAVSASGGASVPAVNRSGLSTVVAATGVTPKKPGEGGKAVGCFISSSTNYVLTTQDGGSGEEIVIALTVVPGTQYSVIVGLGGQGGQGGTAVGGNGAPGRVVLEYEVLS